MTEKRWTLATARSIFSDVRARTERAVESTEKLLAERDALAAGEGGAREALDQRIEAEVSRWAREMEALGLDVKGVWQVDFDTGSGCLCWQWPEDDLDHFHTYEDGFTGRTPIQ